MKFTMGWAKWKAALVLGKEKGPCPCLFGWSFSGYLVCFGLILDKFGSCWYLLRAFHEYAFCFLCGTLNRLQVSPEPLGKRCALPFFWNKKRKLIVNSMMHYFCEMLFNLAGISLWEVFKNTFRLLFREPKGIKFCLVSLAEEQCNLLRFLCQHVHWLIFCGVRWLAVASLFLCVLRELLLELALYLQSAASFHVWADLSVFPLTLLF